MKSRTLAWFTVMTLFAALAIPVGLSGQKRDDKPKHHHYRLIDLGTLGGPSAYKSVNAPGYQILNNAGVVAFSGDTAMTDPDAPGFCYEMDCFVAHAIRWKSAVITDLGALPGNRSSESGAINARGWITGQSENGEVDPLSGLPEVRATLWEADQPIDLGTFGGNWSLGVTLNNRGDVVGFAANTIADPFSIFPPAGTQIRAFLWSNGELRDLGTLGGNDAQATSINERGQVVGNSYTNTIANDVTGIPTIHPFLWEHGEMTDLGTLGGTYAGAGSCGFGAPCPNPLGEPFEGALLINNRSQVIGTSNLAGDLNFHPFLWERGKMIDLGTLGGDNGSAVWLTDDGDVVGQADLPNNPPNCAGDFCVHHAFLWSHGVMTDLGTLGDDPCSRALMMNSNGQIVGTTISICGALSTHAFLWESGGPMVDLNTLISADSGASLFEADNLNERGEIVASGLPAGCDDRFSCGHLFLLTPCDENHPNVEGCDYSLVDGNATADMTQGSNIRSSVANSPGVAVDQLNRMLGDMLAGSHERLASRFRNVLAAASRAPYDLIASALNTYQIRINWQEASGQNQTGFNIYRCHGCTSPRTEGTKIALVGPSVLSFTNGSSTSPLTETTSYTYQVTAFNGSGQSTASNASSATTGTEPAPTNLSSFAFIRGFDDVVRLSWMNNSSDDDSYFVESCFGLTCTNFGVVAQLPANDTSDIQGYQFIHHVTVRYRVRTHSPGGFSTYSNIRNQALP